MWSDLFVSNISITGDFLPNADNTQDIGSSTFRWANGHFMRLITQAATSTVLVGGIALNQAAGPIGVLFSLESDNVNHGVTTVLPTNVYGNFQKLSSATPGGGLRIRGASGTTFAFELDAIGTGEITGGIDASVRFLLRKANGTATQAYGATAQVFGITNFSTGIFMLRGNGDLALGGSIKLSNPAAVIDQGGLALNHGFLSGVVFSIENLSVAHGVTDFLPTNAYCQFRKFNNTAGGLEAITATETITAFNLFGVATTTDTTQTGSSTAAVMINTALKSGTGVTNFADDDNIFAARNNLQTRFLIKGDGDVHLILGTLIVNSPVASITRGGFVSRTTSGGNFQQLIFENSTVAHGMTTLLGTNTFFQLGNLINSGGGTDILSASEDDRATNWFSATGAAEDTTTSTTATANFELSMGTKSGTNVQDVAASGNMFIVSNRATNALIVKGNGALHVNVSTGAGNVGVFDGEQDALACQDIAYAIGGQYKKIMHYATPRLEKLGIMTNGFIHTQALWAMQLGAIGELYGVLNYLLSKQGMDYEAIRQEIRAQA